MKYLDKVVIPEGCNIKFYNDFYKNWYSSLEECLSNSAKESEEYNDTGMISIGIVNLDVFEDIRYSDIREWIHPGMTFKSAIQELSKYAHYRHLFVSKDLSELYVEYFSLSGSEYAIDYNLVYGNGEIIEIGTEIKTTMPLFRDCKAYVYRTLGSTLKDPSIFSTKEELFNLPYSDPRMGIYLCHLAEYMDWEDPEFLPTALITEVL